MKAYTHSGRTPDRILELLEIEHRWMTKAEIARTLEVREETVDRALFRLRKRGLVLYAEGERLTSPSKWRLA